MRRPPRAILFDLDGVLVDSEEAWHRAAAEAGVRFRGGRAITRDEIASTFGQGVGADVEVWGVSCTPAELDAFYEEALPQHLSAVRVAPDARRVVEALAARGLPRALVTNTIGSLARQLVALAVPLELFGSLATADRAEAKPAPDLVLLACSELGVAAEDAWLVGDSRYDQAAARAAGAVFVGLGLPGDETIATLAELLALLGEPA